MITVLEHVLPHSPSLVTAAFMVTYFLHYYFVDKLPTSAAFLFSLTNLLFRVPCFQEGALPTSSVSDVLPFNWLHSSEAGHSCSWRWRVQLCSGHIRDVYWPYNSNTANKHPHTPNTGLISHGFTVENVMHTFFHNRPQTHLHNIQWNTRLRAYGTSATSTPPPSL